MNYSVTRMTRFYRSGLPLGILAGALTLFVFLNSKTPFVGNLYCPKPVESKFIASALGYFLNVRQPRGGTTYAADGAVTDQVFLAYKDAEELRSVNPDCCRIAGLRDADGPLYSKLQIMAYDIETTVEIKAARRVVANEGVLLFDERIDRIPLNSCGDVIPILVGE